jgi:hypothetical protein
MDGRKAKGAQVMQRWAYIVISLAFEKAEQQATLNHLGEKGWELVSVVNDDLRLLAYLRRAASEPERL